MQAVIHQGLHNPLKLKSVPDPVPANGEVLIEVGRCGICGSDLHMTEDISFGKKCGDILGHEFAGDVVALGSGVERVKIGDRVSVVPLKSCGSCPSCLAGEPAWCAEMELQGGGYAELACVRERQCVILPKTASITDGAIVEPLAVALHGVILAGVRPADKVLILGAGPIGLGVAFWARRMGATNVVIQDINRYQEQRALSMGATEFIVGLDDPVTASDQALKGKADIVFECVGVPGIISQAIEQVRVKGTVLFMGLCTRSDSFIPFVALSKEIRLQSAAFFRQQEFEATLSMLDTGVVEPKLFITDTVSLESTSAIFEELKHRTSQCKVLINPSA
jgi:(R,R)-butanediol dehydrogenase/meso-butanediol dehydrogenase/diacetyl reductase